MNELIQQIFDGILEGDSLLVQNKITEAVEAGIPVEAIVNDGMIAAMGEVGRRFECGEFFVPEMFVAARAMQSGMTIVKPHLAESDIKPLGKVVIGTVKGDLHDIGKNLVSVMLEGAGFQIKDLGTNVSPDQFIAVVHEIEPDILAVSALLTTTMVNIGSVVEALEKAGLRKKVKIMIGGAPVTPGFAKQVGADGYAPDASRAVSMAKSLINK